VFQHYIINKDPDQNLFGFKYSREHKGSVINILGLLKPLILTMSNYLQAMMVKTCQSLHVPIKERGTISALDALIEIHLNANEPKTTTSECYCPTKVLDADYKQIFLSKDDIIRICQKKTIPLYGVFPKFTIPMKNGIIRVDIDFRKLKLLLKIKISLIHYYQNWGYDPSNGRVYRCHITGLKYGIIVCQTKCSCSKLM
jgi:hypothetical protein